MEEPVLAIRGILLATLIGATFWVLTLYVVLL